MLQCDFINNLIKDGTVLYQNDLSKFRTTYWSQQQAELTPLCVFTAPDPRAISIAILVSRITACPMAIKSGGHAAYANASSIDSGIIISLERLNQTILADNGTTVAVGAGNTWDSVYSSLVPHGLAVIGGRVSSIGVGGLTLGGGISFFSNLHGWACDNVASYDVVLPSGDLISASPTQNPDLFWALKGGGNNFAIVHTFHLRTFPLPNNTLWGGTRMYTETSFPALTAAFSNLVAPTTSSSDSNAGIWIAWTSVNGTRLAATELWYATPAGDDASIFNEINTIPALSSTTQPRTLLNYTRSLDALNPRGLRESYHTLTTLADARIAAKAHEIFFASLSDVAHVPGVQPVLMYQAITPSQRRAMNRNGATNALGLSSPSAGEANHPENAETLYLLHIACWWHHAADDDAVYAFIRSTLSAIAHDAEKLGAAHDFLYMNYASQFQHVLAGYGADNLRRLRDVAKIYDPQGVMQALVPGGFKLRGPPVS
jgi:hypothetical protein